VDAGVALSEIYIHNTTLEEYYLGVTGGKTA
jgi:hypothetical protein